MGRGRGEVGGDKKIMLGVRIGRGGERGGGEEAGRVRGGERVGGRGILMRKCGESVGARAREVE